MNMLGPLHKTKTGNRFVDVIANHRSMLTSAILAQWTIAAHIAEIVLDEWVMPYGIPERLLTDNGPQLT